jgi:hypothetical protein
MVLSSAGLDSRFPPLWRPRSNCTSRLQIHPLVGACSTSRYPQYSDRKQPDTTVCRKVTSTSRNFVGWFLLWKLSVLREYYSVIWSKEIGNRQPKFGVGSWRTAQEDVSVCIGVSKMTLVHCESRFAVFEGRGQFGNPGKRKRPPLETGTRGLLKDSRAITASECVVNCIL